MVRRVARRNAAVDNLIIAVLFEGAMAYSIGNGALPGHARLRRRGSFNDGASEPMARPPVIDEGDEPVELNIGLDKLQDIVLKARAFDLEDFPDEVDPGSEVDEAQNREERLDEGDDPTEAELRELIDDLNDDEAVDLIALVWIGRGDFGIEELAEARELARERHEGSSSRYLMGIPTLAEYIAEGLAAAGYDLEGLEPN